MRKKTGAKNKKNIRKKTRSGIAGSRTAGRKKYFFGAGSKWLFRLASFLVIAYLAFGIFAGSELLARDLRNKYGKVLGAVNVSVLVRGMPVKPVVTADPGCDGSYPVIDLDWADDLGVDTFDVWRNGVILVAGITSSSYRDSNVDLGTTYTYSVAAHGPLGDEQSDDIFATAETEGYIPPPPPPPANLVITRLDSIDLTNFRCEARTNKKYPTFSGTTNISQARLTVVIISERGIRQVISSFTANANGYWSWKSKGKLKKGVKYVYFTAYDPDDESRSASASLRFRVKKKKPSKKFLKKCRATSLLPAGFGVAKPLHLAEGMKLSVEEGRKSVHQGEQMNFSLSGAVLGPQSKLRVGIVDDKGGLVFEREDSSAGKQVAIDKNMPSGEYKIFARYFDNGKDISAEDSFQVKERPLLILNSGREITSRQILSNLGWAALSLSGLLGIFLLLLLVEHHLAGKALFRVTGEKLKERGMID
jgi:hypothetical protein